MGQYADWLVEDEIFEGIDYNGDSIFSKNTNHNMKNNNTGVRKFIVKNVNKAKNIRHFHKKFTATEDQTKRINTILKLYLNKDTKVTKQDTKYISGNFENFKEWFFNLNYTF